MRSFSEKVVIYGPAYPMNLTPLWVAHDKGFFREEGLDVTLEAVLGIPDAAHPRHQWRKEGKIVFASPGGSPMFRSVREKRGPEDSDINVISIADRTAHVFVAQKQIEDPSQLRGKRLGADRKGGSSIDATIVLRHFGVDPDDVTWVDSRGKPPDTERCSRRVSWTRSAAIHRTGTLRSAWVGAGSLPRATSSCCRRPAFRPRST